MVKKTKPQSRLEEIELAKKMPDLMPSLTPEAVAEFDRKKALEKDSGKSVPKSKQDQKRSFKTLLPWDFKPSSSEELLKREERFRSLANMPDMSAADKKKWEYRANVVKVLAKKAKSRLL